MTTAKEVATKLLEFYGNDEFRWTQGDYASTGDGQSADPTEEIAECWCALGALQLILDQAHDNTPDVKALSAALGMDVDAWNDRCKSFEEFTSDLKLIAEAP